MQFVGFDGANVVLAEGQDEYTTIVGRYEPDTVGLHAATGEEYNAGPSITVALKPSPEELVCLLNGGTMYIRVLGRVFPPMGVWAE